MMEEARQLEDARKQDAFLEAEKEKQGQDERSEEESEEAEEKIAKS